MVTMQNKRYVREYGLHRRSGDRLAIAQRRVDNFLQHLFTALKDHEKALAEYAKSAKRLEKFGS